MPGFKPIYEKYRPWLDEIGQYATTHNVKIPMNVRLALARVFHDSGIDSKAIAEILDQVDFANENPVVKVL